MLSFLSMRILDPFLQKSRNSPQPVFLLCSSSVPGTEKLHLAHEASVSSFLQHLKFRLNSGSAPQHIVHCSNGISSVGWQKNPPSLLLMKALNNIDPSINPTIPWWWKCWALLFEPGQPFTQVAVHWPSPDLCNLATRENDEMGWGKSCS